MDGLTTWSGLKTWFRRLLYPHCLIGACGSLVGQSINRLAPKPNRPRIPTIPVIGDSPVNFNPIIIILMGYLEKVSPNGLQTAVAMAHKKLPETMNRLSITDARSFLEFANDLLTWIPQENYEGKGNLREFLHTPILPNRVGQPLTWLSSWAVVYAQLIGLFLDTPASITAESLQSFKDSPPYNYEEAMVPPGGFRTFNQFFARHLKPGLRPIESPQDDKIIVYPADCAYDNSVVNQSIGSEFAHDFDGGVWMHAFLNTFNYHRQHAPVSGTVIEAKNIQGAAYLEVNAKCQPIRNTCGPDATDSPGYQFLQMRGMVVIDNPVLGKVAVLPIGMAQVSSVKLSVQKGDVLKKGDEISCFQFGGSDIICVFQAKAGLKVESFVPSPGDSYSKMGTVLARAP
ncbi:hypothetical protein ACCO45_004443 [Purpureocillium lilacinum]|uniref:Uncharacterized protein n=1 Tax=Purpureocillium lilacinum TaxID=33203 RepID=A0ACC4E2R5_PURLI